jgi:hypothetical protein
MASNFRWGITVFMVLRNISPICVSTELPARAILFSAARWEV